jgi:hypothetical protein
MKRPSVQRGRFLLFIQAKLFDAPAIASPDKPRQAIFPLREQIPIPQDALTVEREHLRQVG